MSASEKDAPGSGSARLVEHAVGDTIGPYRLLRPLGEGTAGKVFEVEHLRIGRRAAMKIVHRDAAVPSLVKRLWAEAWAVNRIGNPHIVEITDILELADGPPVHALVMELLEGAALADLLADQRPLAPERLLPIMAQVCDALAAVHAAGFVHRDLKPENVFLVPRESTRDFVKLLDFGLVKAARPDLPSPKATVEGTFLGSPAYASPEQAAGREVDFRTDIYAVGVMLHELATGRLPFDAQTIGELLIKQINQPAPHLPPALGSTKLGPTLDLIIQTCMAKDPADRALSAAQLATVFRQLAAGRVAAGRVLSRAMGARRRVRPRPRGWRLVPVAAALAIGAVALVVGEHSRLERARAALLRAQLSALPVARAPRPATTEAVALQCPPPSRPDTAPGAGNGEARKPMRPRRALHAFRPITRTTTLDPYR